MKTINFIKTHLAKLASMAAALVLTAHVFVPAVNIMADNETKNINVAFSTNNEKVEVILNGTTLVKGDTNNIEYLENASTLSLTVKAPYDSVITTLNASDRWGESTSLLDDTFPSAATMADIWKATDSYYIITKDFDIKYLIQSGPNIKPETIAIETTPSGFTTSSLAQSYKHVTPTFISATHGETSYPLTATEDGSLESTTFPTGTKLSFSLATDEHYENPTVKFNDAVVTPENGTYTITLSDATNNLQVSASPILGSITAVAAHGSTSLDLSEKYLEGTTVSFTVDCNDDKYYVDTVTANGETLTPNNNEEYNFTVRAGENTVVVNYAAYEQIDIAAETNEGAEPNNNDSAATEKVKDLLAILAPIEQEITDSIANLKAAIKKAQSVSVSLKSKKVSISDTDAKQFQKIAAAAEDNYKIAGYYDINLKLTVKKSDGNATYRVEKLGSNMTVKLDISDLALPKVPNNYTRKFVVIRGHTYGGTTTATIIDENVTVNGNILTFPTDSFSTYAIAYADTFDASLFRNIDYSNLELSTIDFVSATYDGTTYTDPTRCELFTWDATSAILPEGTELVFDLNPADDYKLSSVNIAGTESDANSTRHSLTVGDQDIAISATTERKSSTFSLGATNGKINFRSATYKNATGTLETYGPDYTGSAYVDPFHYNEDENTLTLPLGATVSLDITPDDGYYVAGVDYVADDDTKSSIVADEDGVYTFILDEFTSSLAVTFGETVITYNTSIKDAKDDNGLARYILDNNFGYTKKFYDIEYIKTITEGNKVTNISLASSDEPISITLDAGILASLKTSYTRTFMILHKDTDGNIQSLSATHNSEDNTVTFSTDSFSGKFAVVYVDTYDESLVSILDFSGVSDNTVVSFVQATYGGNVYNKLPTSDDAFSWTSARATFPVGTVVYFTVTGDKNHDLSGISLNGASLAADGDTGYYAFNAEAAGIYVLSTAASRKTATLDLFIDHGTATITSATYNDIDVSDHLVAETEVIVTITPESGYHVTTTSTTGITAVAKVSENVYSLTLSGGANTFTVNLTTTSSEDDPGNGSDDPGNGSNDPGNGGETDPGTGSGSGTGTGSGTTPGGSIPLPGDPTDSFAPIGGGIQAPSDANSEYFLPEDENGVIRNPNPLKNLTAGISKITVGAKQLTVKLAKVKNAAGYQVVYRIKGTTTWKTTTTTSLTKTIKSLKKGKKYEVKTRAYKKVSGQTFYSKWSAVKTSAKIK